MIRTATLQDLPLLTPLFDGYRQYYSRPSDLPLADAFMRERLTRGDTVLLLATDELGQGVGFAHLFPSFSSVAAARTYILNDLFVVPACRRGGVGLALLRFAEQEARRMGAVRLTLSTQHTNSVAQALYRNAGWQRDDAFAVFHRPLIG